MFMPPTPPSALPTSRWVLVGKRDRVALVKRLSLSFELRRARTDRHAELWVYGDEGVRRWRVPTSARGEILGGGRLAPELQELDLWTPFPGALPLWDQGRCVLDASPFDRLTDALATGRVTLTLRGLKAEGAYRMTRTPMSLGAEPQWRIRREEASAPREERH